MSDDGDLLDLYRMIALTGKVVDILLTCPGIYEHIQHGLAPSGYEVLGEWSAMRRLQGAR